jgi:hypothetical protein
MVDGSCWRLLRQRPSYGAQTPDTGAVHPIKANANTIFYGEGAISASLNLHDIF